jgi:chromosome segregation ATPase
MGKMLVENSNIIRPVHHLVRLSYFQQLLAHRRVLFVGDNYDSAQFLCELRTRHISAITEQPPQTPWPASDDTPGIELQVMQFNDVRFRDRAFDLAIVPDLTVLKDPTASLNEFRRVVGPNGHVIVAAPNPACENPVGPVGVAQALDYYEVYDLLAAVFPNVQMIGQSPFFGYAVADLAFEDDELPVGFDAGLAENSNEEIEWFLSVCGEQAVELDPYSIIQVPLIEAGVGGASAQELEDAQAETEREKENCSRIGSTLEALRGETAGVKDDNERMIQDLEQARHELGNRGVKIESLQKELEVELQQSEAARERAVKLAKEFDNERKAAQKKQLDEEFARRSSTMETQTKLNESEANLRVADERAVAAENSRDEIVGQMRADVAELDRIREKYDSSKEELRRLSEHEKELETGLSSLGQKLSRTEDSLGRKLSRAEEQLVELEPVREELKELKAKAETEIGSFAKENAVLEERLQQTGASLLETQAEIERREALVRDLVVRLEEREAATGDTALQLEHMDMEIAALNGARSGQYHARIEAELALATMTMKVQDLSQELHQLRNQLDENSDDLSTASAKLDAEGGQVAELTANVNDRDLKIANLEGEVQSAKWRANELEARGVDALEQLAKAQTDLETRLVENENLGNQLQEFESELAALNGARAGQHRARVEAELELATANVKLTGLQANLTEMLAKSSDLERQADEGREQLLQLTKEVESTQSQLKEVRAESDQVIADRDKVRDEYAKARLKVEELKSNLSSAQGQIEGLARASDMAGELSGQIEKERSRASGFETGLAEAERQMSALKEELETERSNRVELDGDLSNRQERAEALEKELTAAQDSCARLTDERDEAVEERKQFENSIEEKNAGSKRLEEDLKIAQEKAEALGTALETQERSARIFEEEFDQQRSRTRDLENDLSGARQRVEDLEREIEDSAKIRVRMENDLAALSERLDESERTAADSGDAATQAAKRIRKAEEQIAALTVELRGAHEQRAVLEKNVENVRTSVQQEVAEDLQSSQKIAEEIENVKEQLAQAQTALDRETSRNEVLTAAVEVLRSDLACEADRTVQAGTDAARVAGEIEEIKGQLVQRGSELKEAIEERAASEVALTELRDEIARLDSDYRKARSNHVEDSRQTKELAEQVQQLEISEKRLAEKEQEFAGAQEHLAETKKELIESRDLMAQTEEVLGGVQEQVKELERELEDVQEQAAAAENKLVASAQSKVGISAQLADALQEKDEAVAEFTAALEDIEKAKEAQEVVENRIVELEAQTQEIKEASVSSSEVSKLKSDLEAARGECTAALNEIESLTQILVEKETELDEAKSQASEIIIAEPVSETPDSNEMDKLREMVGEREALVDSLTGQLEERERRATGLERKIREMTNQLHEHESDIAAWNMELKFRNSRISQLESQLATMKLSIPPGSSGPGSDQ